MFAVPSQFYYLSDRFNTLVTPTFSGRSSITTIFYEQSLLFAINNKAIKEKRQKNKDLTQAKKFKIGAIQGAQQLLTVIPLCLGFVALDLLRGKSSENEKPFELPSLFSTCTIVLIEELVLRGIMHNCFKGLQNIAINKTPKSLQDNRVFKWLTSPSARIVAVSATYAGFCFTDMSKKCLNHEDSLAIASAIMLGPVESILYETTGDMIAPFASNLTGNLLAWSLMSALAPALIEKQTPKNTLEL